MRVEPVQCGERKTFPLGKPNPLEETGLRHVRRAPTTWTTGISVASLPPQTVPAQTVPAEPLSLNTKKGEPDESRHRRRQVAAAPRQGEGRVGEAHR